MDRVDQTRTATDSQIRWLIDTYGTVLYRVAVAVVRDAQLAEDVVQEVLVKAWTSMPSWDGDVPVKWARTVTKNTALNAMRSRAARPTVPSVEFDATDPADFITPGPAERVVRSEAADEMWALLTRIDPEARFLLVLHEIDGLAYDEIADTADLTVSAVKSKIYRARRTLRSDLTR